MGILGRVKGGVVVLDDSDALPEGTVVRVEAVEETESHAHRVASGPFGKATRRGEEGPSIWDKLLRLAGTAKGLPPDLARNHDHYLHGLPKR